MKTNENITTDSHISPELMANIDFSQAIEDTIRRQKEQKPGNPEDLNASPDKTMIAKNTGWEHVEE